MRNGARKTFAWLVVSILITTCRAQSVPGPRGGGQFDFQSWLEDFGQLTAEMAAHYASLESSQRERHMDLPKLRQETETKLRQACDEQQAQKNLRGFIEAFADDHLELKWPKPSDQKTASETSSNSTSAPKQPSLCPRLGYPARHALHESRATVPCSERGFGRGELKTLKPLGMGISE